MPGASWSLGVRGSRNLQGRKRRLKIIRKGRVRREELGNGGRRAGWGKEIVMHPSPPGLARRACAHGGPGAPPPPQQTAPGIGDPAHPTSPPHSPSSLRSPAPVCSEPCALSVSHRSRVNGTQARAHTHIHTPHTRSHTRAHVHTHRARQLDASGHRASPASLTFLVLMYSPPPPPAPAVSLTGRPQAGSLSPLA